MKIKKAKPIFFILDKLEAATPKAVSTPADTIAALDIIEVDESYKKLSGYLLNNVFITANESAETVAGTVLLHKSGKLVRGEYTVSGGSVGLFEGKKIGRAKNLEKLYSDIVLQGAKVQATQKEITHWQHQIISLQEQLKDNDIKLLQNEINQLNNAVFVNKNKIETIHTAQQQTQQRLQDINTKLKGEQEDMAAAREQLHDLTVRLRKYSSRNRQCREKQ